MQTVLVRASVLTKVYLANVVVLDVLSNPSDGSCTRRVVEVVELAVFAATVVVHVLTRYLTFRSPGLVGGVLGARGSDPGVHASMVTLHGA